MVLCCVLVWTTVVNPGFSQVQRNVSNQHPGRLYLLVNTEKYIILIDILICFTRFHQTHAGPKHSTRRSYSVWGEPESHPLAPAAISGSPGKVWFLETGVVYGETHWTHLLGDRMEWESSHRSSIQKAVQEGRGSWQLVGPKWLLLVFELH